MKYTLTLLALLSYYGSNFSYAQQRNDDQSYFCRFLPQLCPLQGGAFGGSASPTPLPTQSPTATPTSAQRYDI